MSKNNKKNKGNEKVAFTFTASVSCEIKNELDITIDEYYKMSDSEIEKFFKETKEKFAYDLCCDARSKLNETEADYKMIIDHTGGLVYSNYKIES